MPVSEEEITPRERAEGLAGAVIGIMLGQLAEQFGLEAMVDFERALMSRLVPAFAKTLGDPELQDAVAEHFAMARQHVEDAPAALALAPGRKP